VVPTSLALTNRASLASNAASGATDSADTLDLKADQCTDEACEGLADCCLLPAGFQTVSGAEFRPVRCVLVVDDCKHAGLVGLHRA